MGVRKSIIYLTLMSLLSLFGCGRKAAPTHPQDVLTAKDGSEITITFYGHASVAFAWNGHNIYVDPVGDDIDWKKQPKGDLILITHGHGDHFDLETVENVEAVKSLVIASGEVVEAAFEQDAVALAPGQAVRPFSGETFSDDDNSLEILAVPAYNITEGHLQFHPKERGDCGYILTLGGTRIYVAGDTEDNDDVLSIRDIDVAFIPVNQPYTMTVEQAANVIRAIRPAIFYPYHYGQVDTVTDLDALTEAVRDVCEIRIRPLA